MRPHFRSFSRFSSIALALAVFAITGCPPPPAATTNDNENANINDNGDGNATAVGVQAQLIVVGLTAPIAMEAPSDGTRRLFVADQAGLLRVIDGGSLRDAPMLDLRGRMVTLSATYDERGLLGLALHPQFAANRRLFVCYSAPKSASVQADFDSELHVSEFLVRSDDSNTVEDASERILLTIPKPQANHNGGGLAFGPDGFLYVSVGDGGAANDDGVGHNTVTGNAQDKRTLLGKLLRIDADTGQAPADNPFVGVANAAPAIWALGLRNPWRFSFDRGGARRLFLADVGQNRLEEIDIITRGGNYGWRVREGNSCFDSTAPDNPPAVCPSQDLAGNALTPPILDYPHRVDGASFGLAVVGGYFYRGSAVAALADRYIFADWSRGFTAGDGTLFTASEQTDGTWTREELSLVGRDNGRLGRFILSFGQDTDGELYVLTSNSLGPTGQKGEVYKLVSSP
ncbi:MAG: PQQ-dependent sugar dehydrogenase [Phycisphaerae bacterium]